MSSPDGTSAPLPAPTPTSTSTPAHRPVVRPGTGILVVSPESRLLIVQQERDRVVDWGPLGGGLEHGEGIEECAVREAHEESGLRVKLVRLLSVDEFWHLGRLERVGFVFLAEPDPWPQNVSLPIVDGDTRFLDHRWIAKDEVRRFAGKDAREFWACHWPLDVRETLVRRLDVER
ncbi:NUDIX domain-containing protein [Actinopolymorpha pittospori]|uniref:ADP-ribose pyrophosphatase YjhB (NUDIX family) n=1 Tax=Actinopolymorpha pittospori TaxID=648752 RepID=A0A927MTJ5_9ACTN|nr:ADP-ribose pyrophosphatase YjhB (NUDIX family) [Actinopolymorpha pittospori]